MNFVSNVSRKVARVLPSTEQARRRANQGEITFKKPLQIAAPGNKNGMLFILPWDSFG